jgi:gamma-glutamylputrescine oxidase
VFSVVLNTSLWLDNKNASYPSLNENIEADVIIVGGGITGISAAYHFGIEGLSTVLLEGEVIGGGTTGLSLGILAIGNESDLQNTVNLVGEEKACKIWNDSIQAIKLIEDVISKHNIDCEFQKTGGIYLAVKKRHSKIIENEVKIRNKLGFSAEFLDKNQIKSKVNSNCFYGGLFSPYECQLNPVKFVKGLANIACEKSVKIFENSKVKSIERDKEKFLVRVNDREVRGNFLVLAAGADMESFGVLTDKVLPIYTHAIATEPLKEDMIEKIGWLGREVMWDSLYIYRDWRLTKDNRIIIGGDDCWVSNGKSYKNLFKVLLNIFPELKDINVTHYWSGRIGFTSNSIPIIGMDIKNKNLIYSSGYGGHGLTFGFLGGKIICDLICNKNVDDISIYSGSRKSKKFNDWVDKLKLPKKIKLKFVQTYLSWLKIKDKIP